MRAALAQLVQPHMSAYYLRHCQKEGVPARCESGTRGEHPCLRRSPNGKYWMASTCVPPPLVRSLDEVS